MKKVTRVVLVVSLALNVVVAIYVPFLWYQSYWTRRVLSGDMPPDWMVRVEIDPISKEDRIFVFTSVPPRTPPETLVAGAKEYWKDLCKGTRWKDRVSLADEPEILRDPGSGGVRIDWKVHWRGVRAEDAPDVRIKSNSLRHWLEARL